MSLLIRGQRVDLPGPETIGPGDVPWAKLSPEDYRKRDPKDWIRQIIVHTTKGTDPQHVKPGRGSGGRGKQVADYWSGSSQSSGAQLVVDNDGSIACLADLALDMAFHATTSNRWSIGIEMYQELDGGIYEATYASTIALVLFLCERMSIALQTTGRVYNGDAIDRMKFDGGPDMCGVFGHRDNAWDFVRKTSSRGRGDPGDEIYRRLALAGWEQLDFEARQDIAVWRLRQRVLNDLGEHLTVDGIAGPATIAAMRRRGFRHGREITA
jgi:hypothetical protein